MIDRLLAAPNPDDPELPARTADPLLSAVKDDLGTRAALGHRVVIPTNGSYQHRLDSVKVSGTSASVRGCDLDDSTTIGPSGEMIDDSVVTRTVAGTFSYDGTTWRASDVRVVARANGITECVA